MLAAATLWSSEAGRAPVALTEEETACPPWCAPEGTAAATEAEGGGPGAACCCCCLAYIIAASGEHLATPKVGRCEMLLSADSATSSVTDTGTPNSSLSLPFQSVGGQSGVTSVPSPSK